MDSERYSRGIVTGLAPEVGALSSRALSKRIYYKKIYLALRFPAVWPKAPTVGAEGSLQ